MDIHWRNTHKPVRFFMLDARSAIFVLIFMVHTRLWTFSIAMLMMFAFWVLERRGLTFYASLRALRCWILGENRPANHRRAFRYWIEYDGS